MDDFNFNLKSFSKIFLVFIIPIIILSAIFGLVISFLKEISMCFAIIVLCLGIFILTFLLIKYIYKCIKNDNIWNWITK